MSLRILYALSGSVLAYGAVHGVALYNLVFGVGVVLLALAAAVGWRAEHSLWGVWPALVTCCGFFALLGVQTFGLPDCGSFTQLASGAVACLASPNSRVITLSAIVGLVVGLALGTMDVASIRRRSPDSLSETSSAR